VERLRFGSRSGIKVSKVQRYKGDLRSGMRYEGDLRSRSHCGYILMPDGHYAEVLRFVTSAIYATYYFVFITSWTSSAGLSHTARDLNSKELTQEIIIANVRFSTIR